MVDKEQHVWLLDLFFLFKCNQKIIPNDLYRIAKKQYYIYT